MKLVWRRAVEARGLLLAAAVAALVAVALVTGLADYNRQRRRRQRLLDAAPAEERSLLVSGFRRADVDAHADRDRAVRAEFAAGLGGLPTTVAAARYGTGRELTGDLGPARVDDDPIFATLATLADLPAHAELTAGAWPTAGATPMQVTLPEKIAGRLGLHTGDRVPLRDRSAERADTVVVAGTWRPREPTEAYWRLAPGLSDNDPSSYGPFTVDPADFVRTFPGSVSAAWLVAPDLAAVEPSRLGGVKQVVAAVAAKIPDTTGLGSSAQTATAMDRLIDRLSRADLVGRSALLTPLLLIVVLGGYALVLVAALLTEDRRAQTALLRARAARPWSARRTCRTRSNAGGGAGGAGPRRWPRRRCGGSAATCAWPAAASVRSGGRRRRRLSAPRHGAAGAAPGRHLRRRHGRLGPAPTRVRPCSGATADLALVALAVLAWTQLRQYSSPRRGPVGRPASTRCWPPRPLGVLAGAVVALRLLPPATRFAERFVDRRPWTATMFGMGRRVAARTPARCRCSPSPSGQHRLPGPWSPPGTLAADQARHRSAPTCGWSSGTGWRPRPAGTRGWSPYRGGPGAAGLADDIRLGRDDHGHRGRPRRGRWRRRAAAARRRHRRRVHCRTAGPAGPGSRRARWDALPAGARRPLPPCGRRRRVRGTRCVGERAAHRRSRCRLAAAAGASAWATAGWCLPRRCPTPGRCGSPASRPTEGRPPAPATGCGSTGWQ
ncbi:hypothetical protein MRQ36_21360 [Micromonospora sp. R77]|uniref:hypothetical protein n=1 Tax=Micromonospora sp. R77 TaxID=2925836 RepID=UPI001F5FF65F|nr:hypothetical protein [Micromonospora sp. R77]MCI4064977.1 hypothetical protein [Micromonospora sp. R77]